MRLDQLLSLLEQIPELSAFAICHVDPLGESVDSEQLSQGLGIALSVFFLVSAISLTFNGLTTYTPIPIFVGRSYIHRVWPPASTATEIPLALHFQKYCPMPSLSVGISLLNVFFPLRSITSLSMGLAYGLFIVSPYKCAHEEVLAKKCPIPDSGIGH